MLAEIWVTAQVQRADISRSHLSIAPKICGAKCFLLWKNSVFALKNITTKLHPLSTSSACSFQPCWKWAIICSSINISSTTSRMPMARRPHLCPSLCGMIMAQACMFICLSGRTNSHSLRVTNMQVSQQSASITSAVSSSTLKRSMLSQMPQQTLTSVWFQVLKRQLCLHTHLVTAQPLSVFRGQHHVTVSVLKHVSRIQRVTHTSHIQPYLWLVLTVSKTKSTQAIQWIWIYMNCLLLKLTRFHKFVDRFVKPLSPLMVTVTS